MNASASGLTFNYRLDTSGGTLSSAQIPFAPASAPQFAGDQPITVGVQNPAHIVQFVEQAAHESSPAGYAKFLARQAAVAQKDRR